MKVLQRWWQPDPNAIPLPSLESFKDIVETVGQIRRSLWEQIPDELRVVATVLLVIVMILYSTKPLREAGTLWSVWKDRIVGLVQDDGLAQG